MSISIFRKNKISSSPRVLSFIIMGFQEGDFILDPDYQRAYVWKKEQQQALMYSLFNNLPIGAFALLENPNSETQAYIEVVDGKQRMTTIFKFFNNEFPYYCSITKKDIYFKELSLVDQRQFKNSLSVSVNTLDANISELEKFEYFHAVNFSGVPQSDSHRSFVEEKIKELKMAA